MITPDAAFYLTTYLGVDPGQGLDRLLARAAESVNLACPGGLQDLDEETTVMVKRAVCAQVEFWVLNGETYNEAPIAGSEKIGTYERATGFQQREPVGSLCVRARQILEPAGLLFRGVRVL